MQFPSSPVVDFCTGRAVGIEGRVFALLWFVEAKTVASAVFGTAQLLQQEDHGFMNDAKHPQSVHTWDEQKKTVS